MTYLTKTLETGTIIEYSYGRQEDDYIGTISFDKSIRYISENNIELSYYGDYSFCRATTDAIKAVANFIEEGFFPEKYLRATH